MAEAGAKGLPHFHGHRQRLRERFLTGGRDALPDYELLELLLFMAIPRIDTKPLAKSLIDEFGSFADAIAAPVEQLRKAGRARGNDRGAQGGRGGGAEAGQGKGDRAPGAVVLGSAARLLRHGDEALAVSHGTLYSFMWRQRDRGVIPFVTNRDLRRTWKTLGGQAGVPKEIRDRIQNHALQDVSSKSYDRWNYMPEKRAGMAKWDKFVRALLAKKRRLNLAA